MAEVRKQEHENVADLPEGFKMTELGPLPEDWQVVRLGETIRSVKGRKPPVIIETPLTDGLPYLTAEYFRSNTANQFVPREFLNSVEICEKNDVVLIWDGSKAGQVFIGLKGVLASTMVRLDPKPGNLERSFLYFYLLTQFEILNSQTTGSTIPHVNKTLFFNLLIPLPPLPEQRAIAHVLRTVQRAKEATVQVIQATREMKKSLMRHLFTYGPVPVGEAERVPLRETEVGLVPEHWKVQVLENVASFVRDSLNPSNYPDEVFDYYSIPAYQETGSPILEVGKRIRSQKLVVEANDVLFGKLNPRIPKVLLVTASRRRKITSTEFIPLRASSRTVVPEYLYYLCWSNYVMRKAQELVSGSTPSRQRVDVRAFLSLPVPLPPLSEQREIVRILQSADKKLQAEEARKKALEELFKTLLHNLMTGKVRIKDLLTENGGN
ncbi:MAG: type restriction enzyme subunit [Bacillota bacterium]|nr:type restriction enzyme subunit [Bacillota bacterium]